jgi:hypothetical protein
MIDDWLFAECSEKLGALIANHDNDDKMGKWLIFSPPESADGDWHKIKSAVEAGQLSVSAKVATYLNWILSNEGAPRHFVICVYTSDWRDRGDVFNHRNTLRTMGFHQELYYKTNEMTRLGKGGHTYRG